MSVAIGATGGAGGYMPMQTAMPQMKAPNYNTSSTSDGSNFRMPSFAGPSEGNKDLKGDLSGDECLTLDVDDVVQSAVWQESSCECVISAASLPSDQCYDPVARANQGKISLFVAEAVRKLVQRSAAAQAGQDAADAGKKVTKKQKKKKESSLACGKGGVTLVLPCSLSQGSLRAAALSVTGAGCGVKNIFGRGIATVTGMLARSAAFGPNPGPPNNLITVLDAKRKSGSLVSEYPVVMYLHFGKGEEGEVAADASLIVLESGNGVKNNLGYERLSTLAVTERRSKREGLELALGEIRSLLLQTANMDQKRISAVVFGGSSSGEDEKERSAAVSKVFPGLSLYRALREDAARGGCLLSAAELDSSKEYLQQQDGSWVLAYQLPVADGYMSKEVGLTVRTGPSHPDTPVETIFSSRRLWKTETGPIRPGSIATQEEGLTRVTRDYTSVSPGAVSMVSKLLGRTAVQAPGRVYGKSGEWPKLRLLERVSSSDPWTEITGEDYLPLMISSKAPQEEDKDKERKMTMDPVESCSVTFFLNPSTGCVCVAENKGKMVKDRRAETWFWMQVAGSILLIMLLFASPFLFSFFRERSVKAEHTKWLTDFYLKHAPEKLKDPLYVERTVLKYKGRMFLLWRGLKRTYSVDFPAPSSILEGVGMDL